MIDGSGLMESLLNSIKTLHVAVASLSQGFLENGTVWPDAGFFDVDLDRQSKLKAVHKLLYTAISAGIVFN